MDDLAKPNPDDPTGFVLAFKSPGDQHGSILALWKFDTVEKAQQMAIGLDNFLCCYLGVVPMPVFKETYQ